MSDIQERCFEKLPIRVFYSDMRITQYEAADRQVFI